jgi:hypothetical protein
VEKEIINQIPPLCFLLATHNQDSILFFLFLATPWVVAMMEEVEEEEGAEEEVFEDSLESQVQTISLLQDSTMTMTCTLEAAGRGGRLHDRPRDRIKLFFHSPSPFDPMAQRVSQSVSSYKNTLIQSIVSGRRGGKTMRW